MLHFNQSVSINVCVKQLLVSFHGGFLWINKKVSVDVELIAVVTGLPLPGIESASYFKKYQDTMLETKMKDTYNFSRDTIGFLINSINDHTVQLTAKIWTTKLLKKMQSNQCIAGEIKVVEPCAEGVQI